MFGIIVIQKSLSKTLEREKNARTFVNLWKYNSIFILNSHADVITHDGWVGRI